MFDVVQSNIGEGYDTVTGIFTCPFSGLYYFGVASYSTTSYMILQLVKEDVELTGAFADSAVKLISHTPHTQRKINNKINLNKKNYLLSELSQCIEKIPNQNLRLKFALTRVILI